MQTRSLLAAALVTLVSLPLLADSIDDAEAKRRGVPVAQVQAENALAKEKLKTAALEKQIADLQKQMANLPGGSAAAVPASTTASGVPINFDGPRASSPLYDDLVKRYLNGDWLNLPSDLIAKEKEIAALPAGSRADLSYIKQTVAECRPAWWEDVKKGKEIEFRTSAWKFPIDVSFKPNDLDTILGYARKNGAVVTQLGLHVEYMDSRESMPIKYGGIGAPFDCDFVYGDGVHNYVWRLLGAAYFVEKNPKPQNLSAAESGAYNLAWGFWMSLTSAYYGTPASRRLSLIQSAVSFNPRGPRDPSWKSQRPFVAAFLIDARLHPDRYKSLPLDTVPFSKITVDDQGEFQLADDLITRKMRLTGFTLAEDRAMRDLVANLALANPNWKTSKITLPNKLSIDLDPDQDTTNTIERTTFLRDGPPATQKGP